MKIVAIILSIGAAGLLGAGLFLGVFDSRGECTISCQGIRPQDNWSNSYGPYADFTHRRCKDEARHAQVEGIRCQASFVQP